MPTLRQRGHRRLHRQHRALDVGGEDRVDVLLGHVLELGVREHPGVGAQHVETAEAIDRLGHHALGVRRHPDVRTHIRHLSAVGAQLGGGLRPDSGIAADNRDPGAGREEYRGDAPADAFGPAGDKNAPAGYGGEHSAASPSGSRGSTGSFRPARR